MADISDVEKKAIDFAADLTKQLITLSTSIVTITLLFSKDAPKHSALARSAWTAYLCSTLCGLWTLMALTGVLAPRSTDSSTPTTYALQANVRLPSALQIIAFAIAIALTIAYVYAYY